MASKSTANPPTQATAREKKFQDDRSSGCDAIQAVGLLRVALTCDVQRIWLGKVELGTVRLE